MRYIDQFRADHPEIYGSKRQRRNIQLESDSPAYSTLYMRERRKTPGGRREIASSNLRARHGLSLEQYEQLYRDQRGQCAICGRGIERAYDPASESGKRGAKPHGAHIDHDHRCCATSKSCGQCVRGLLCSRCNTGLMGFRDDPQIMLAAIEYLKRDCQAVS
jgi:hypothetical protein